MKIDFYGDSFIYGYNGTTGGGRVATPMPATVQALMPQHIIRNEGVNSNTTTKMLAGTDGVHGTWATQMAATDAAAVVIASCFNDANSISTSQYTTNLTTMHSQAVSAGKIVVFMSCHQVDPSKGSPSAHAAAMKALAGTLGIGYIDLYNWSLAYFTTTPVTYYVPDGYHPNQTTYTMIGGYVARVLNDAIANLAQPYGRSDGWKFSRTYYDEFDGPYTNTTAQGLDGDRWSSRIWYTSDDSVKNFTVSGSKLKIWPDTGFVDRHITTDPAVLGTGKGFAQKYGYVEAKIKMPYGKGCWPAFWMINHDDATVAPPGYRPEIDIMECYCSPTDTYWSSTASHATRTSATVHPQGAQRESAGTYGTSQLGPQTYVPGTTLDAAAHVYAAEWDATGITFYFDGTALGSKLSATMQSPYDKLFVLLSLQFQSWSAAGSPDGTTPTGSSNSMEIDYVRVWQNVDYASVPTGEPDVTATSGTPPTPTSTLVFADRVKETTTTTGTGDISLAGALTGYQSFLNVCAVGDTFYGCIEAVDAFGIPTGAWEVGLYTFGVGNTVQRTTVLRSSNSNSLVNFGAGTKYVFLDLAASFARTLKQVTTTTPGPITPPPSTGGGGTNTNLRPYLLDSNGNVMDTTATYGALVFNDEFSGALNTSIWNPAHISTQGSSAVKNYDTATYTDSKGVQRTVLRIWPQIDPSLPVYQDSNPSHPQNQFFRRDLSTTGSTGFQYTTGYWEMACKLNRGRGLFQALWLFNDTTQQEIDIMESYHGGDGYWSDGSYNATDWAITAWHVGGGVGDYKMPGGDGRKWKDFANGGNPKPTPGFTGEWHTYGMHWGNNELKFYFDGRYTGVTVTHNGWYNQPMYFILDGWYGYVGHTASYPTVADTPQGTSNALELDWLRVWKLGP